MRNLGLFLLAGWVCAQTGQRTRAGFDSIDTRRIKADLTFLSSDALEGRRSRQISAWTFWEGRIGAKQVVVSRTEVGPINAIAATVLGIDHYQPNLIINHGTAGAHNPELRLWDIVVGERTVDYGAYTWDHADAGSGINPAGWKPDPHRLRLDGRERTPFYTFSGDARAIETATAIKNPRGRVFRGTIGGKALHSKSS